MSEYAVTGEWREGVRGCDAMVQVSPPIESKEVYDAVFRSTHNFVLDGVKSNWFRLMRDTGPEATVFTIRTLHQDCRKGKDPTHRDETKRQAVGFVVAAMQKHGLKTKEQ